nr:MAG TPA: hypothetical protein [Caudoviricetes sp.]
MSLRSLGIFYNFHHHINTIPTLYLRPYTATSQASPVLLNLHILQVFLMPLYNHGF